MSAVAFLVAMGAVPAAGLALGAVLVASAAKAERTGTAAGGVAAVATVVAFTSFSVSLAQGWLAAIVLPSAFILAALVYARGRNTGSWPATLGGAAIAIAALTFALEPVLETSWSPASFDNAMRVAGAGWPAAGALLFAGGLERLRTLPWIGWIPYGERGGPALAASAGFALLVLTPAFAAVLSNVGA